MYYKKSHMHFSKHFLNVYLFPKLQTIHNLIWGEFMCHPVSADSWRQKNHLIGWFGCDQKKTVTSRCGPIDRTCGTQSRIKKEKTTIRKKAESKAKHRKEQKMYNVIFLSTGLNSAWVQINRTGITPHAVRFYDILFTVRRQRLELRGERTRAIWASA